MKRALLSFLAFSLVLAAVAGFAASMNVGGSTLGAGTGNVTKCDDVTVTWGTPTWDTSAFKVATVTITEDNSDESASPAHDCTGKAVQVRVGTATATGTLTGTPATATLTLSASVAATAVSTVDVVVN